MPVADVIQALRQAEAQTDEVASVVHGKWIEMVSIDGILWTHCSECGHTRFGRAKLNYCPHCGAKMLGDAREEYWHAYLAVIGAEKFREAGIIDRDGMPVVNYDGE